LTSRTERDGVLARRAGMNQAARGNQAVLVGRFNAPRTTVL
jgi:hypothetical protein